MEKKNSPSTQMQEENRENHNFSSWWNTPKKKGTKSKQPLKMNFKVKNNCEYERIPPMRNSKTQNKNEKAADINEKETDQTGKSLNMQVQ